MSMSERAARSFKPCKKQMAPFASKDAKRNSTEFSTSNNSSINLNDKVNTCIKSSFSSSSFSSVSLSTIPETKFATTPEHKSNIPSKTIKNALKQASKATWKASLPNTSKSVPIQQKMATYFKTIASSKSSNKHPKLEVPEYLPAQRLFRLGAKIKKSHIVQQVGKVPQSKETQTHTSSPSDTILQESDVPYSYENMSWRLQSNTGSPSEKLNKVLNRDLKSSHIPSMNIDSHSFSSSVPSSNESNPSKGESSFLPSQSFSPPNKATMTTRRQNHSRLFSSNDKLSSDSLSQMSSNSISRVSNPIVCPEQLLQKCFKLHSPIAQESSIESSKHSPKASREALVAVADFESTIPLPQIIPNRIKLLLRRIESDSDSISQLRKEYDTRATYIHTQLEELSISTRQSSDPTGSSFPLAQTINFSETSSISSSDETHTKEKKIQKSRPKYDFSRLNFAGNLSDNTFLSEPSKSSSSSSSSVLQKPHTELSSTISESQNQTSPLSPFLKCNSNPETRQVPHVPSHIGIPVQTVDKDQEERSNTKTPTVTSPKYSKQEETSSMSDQQLEPKRNSFLMPNQDIPSTTRLSHATEMSSSPRLEHVAATREPPTSKGRDSIRVIAQNCNGAFHRGHTSSEHYIPSMESLQGYSPDVICLSETNTDWKVHDMGYDTMLTNKVLWDPSPTKTVLASCTWKNLRRTTYQPGGVMTLCLNSLPSRIKSTKNDRYGRYTKIVFQGKGSTSISLYNVYRPNPGSASTSGIETVWFQQFQCFRNLNKDVDPRDECIKDIINEIQQDYENNILPILVGDFNEDLQHDKGFGIKNLMSSCSLKQAYQYLHQSIPSSRLNHRSVFHIFMSSKLIKYVERIGVLPLHSGFHKSDHIPFYIDFHKDMLTSKQNPMVYQSIRKLKMYDSPSVEKYICYVKDQMNHHNIIRRFLNLKDYIATFAFDSSAEKELDLLDRQMTDIRIRSENKLRPDPSRFKNASPMQLQVARIRHLQSIAKRMKLDLPTQELVRLLKNIGLENVDLTSQEAIETRITNERQLLKFLHEEEDVVREDHLQALYEKAMEVQDKNKSSIIKNMKMREMQKRTWSKIRYVTQNSSNRNVERLGIPRGFETQSTAAIWHYLSDPSSKPSYIYITDPQQIERRLLEWQYLHYGQAKETPLASKEWRDLLDPNKLSDLEMDEIMKGKFFQDSNLPVESKSFLAHMIRDVQPEMSSEKVQITQKIFSAFYKGAKESTSSSPSGLHLGHWKSCALDPDISMVLSGIIDLAVTNLYTLPRWRKVVSILMEKIHGSPYIHKFRTIHLLESDLNFVLRYIWGKMFMRHNEDLDAFNANQYGSRRGIQGQSATLNKVLTLDTVRYYAVPAAIVDKDAKACYDRIIPVVLVYALIRLGLPKNLTRFMCKWLEQAKYFIKTASGVSEHSYQNTVEEYLYGTGQGTGWSPPNWGAISDVISCAMEENAPGMYLQHPSRKFHSSRTYDSFVDDVNGGLTEDGMYAFHPSPNNPVPILQGIYNQIQANVQYYSRLLFTSGGKLALDKCGAYILEFKWNKGIKSFVDTTTKYPPLKIDQKNSNQPDDIQLLHPSEARKMLGAYSAPDGQSKAQYEVLLQLSKNWGKKVSNGYLNRYDVLTGFKCGLIPALQYPLGVSMLSEKQCDNLLIPAMTPLLRKLGIVSTVNREIVHGPYEYGGLQIPNLFTIQGIHKIKMFLGHMRKEDTTGSIVKIALGILQQEIGVSTPVLELPFKKYSLLASHCWMKELWRFLSSIEGSIKVEQSWVPTPAYSNDTNIMETVLEWDISEKQKQQINLCRLYFRVYYLGEILDSTASRLKRSILSFSSQNYHQDKFPKIEIPTSFHDIWNYAVRRLIRDNPIGTSLGYLVSTNSFQWKTIDDGDFLIQHHYRKSPKFYRMISEPHKKPVFTKVHEVLVPDEYKISGIASVTALSSTKICLKHKRPLRQFPQLDSPTSSYRINSIVHKTSNKEKEKFKELLQSLGPAHVRNIGLLHSLEHLREIAIAISTGKLMGVGDSSVNDYETAHSYILETIPPRVNICGVAPVDCSEEDTTSNRGESCTVLAMVSLISVICQLYNIQKGSATVYCDNLQGLRRRIVSKSTYTTLNFRDTDVKMELEFFIQNLPIKMSFKHVKGHADEHPDFVYDRAPQQTQRNIDMDKNAKLFLLHPPPHLKPTNTTTYFPAQKAALQIHNQIIVGDVFVHISMQKHGLPMENRLEEKQHIPHSVQHAIDWPALKLAVKQSDLNQKIAAMKIMHTQWPTAQKLASRDKSLSNTCLRCSKSIESFAHIFRCRSRDATSSFRISLLSFLKKMKALKTASPIVDCFKTLILAFQRNETPVCPTYTFGSTTKYIALQKAFQHQILLGPSSFISGYLSYKWSVIQTLYTSSSFNTIYNISWASQVIRSIWAFSSSLWTKRCAQVHKKIPGLDATLTMEELKSSIKPYLRLSRATLSSLEKKLHDNVRRHITRATSTTLARWLHLLSTEREKTIRSKREDGIRKGGLRQITSFYRRRSSL